MKPFLIGIGGGGSGCGKTYFACLLLARLRNFAALKCTRTHLYTCIVDDPAELSKPDKDTGRMLASGAAAAIWVQSTREDMPETLPVALSKLSAHECILVEGNSAIEVLTPDIVIFISGPEGRIKPSAHDVLMRSDVVVHDSRWPLRGPAGARYFDLRQEEELLEYVAVQCRKRRGLED